MLTLEIVQEVLCVSGSGERDLSHYAECSWSRQDTAAFKLTCGRIGAGLGCTQRHWTLNTSEYVQLHIQPDVMFSANTIIQTGDFKEYMTPQHPPQPPLTKPRAMNFGEFNQGKAQQPLPPSLAPHESQIATFRTLCTKTCSRILTLLALGLDIQEDFFTTRHDPTTGPTGSILRFLYYPSLSSPTTAAYKHDKDVRAGAHSDYGSITLLFQRPGQPGLEIRTPEGSWAPVPIVPGPEPGQFPFPPILVNIGDLLSYWTDGLLKSTVHRVVFPLEEQRSSKPQDRYTLVYFCHPVDETELVPVPSKVVERHLEQVGGVGVVGFGGGAGTLEPGKRPLTAAEHLESRLAATYGFRQEK